MRNTWIAMGGVGVVSLFIFFMGGGEPFQMASCTLALVLMTGLVGWLLQRTPTQRGPLDEGVRLLNRGRYSQALALFEAQRALAPKDPIIAFDVGVATLQLWQLDRAAAAFNDAWTLRATAGGQVAFLSAAVPEHLAFIAALRNEAAAARQWQLAANTADAMPARLTLAEAVLCAREAKWAEARALLSSFEVKQLGGLHGQFVRTLDALCIERLTGELRHLDRVALFGETGSDGLRKAWPELVDFIERAPAW